MRSSSLPQTMVVPSWTVRALALRTDPLEETGATGFFFPNVHQILEGARRFRKLKVLDVNAARITERKSKRGCKRSVQPFLTDRVLF